MKMNGSFESGWPGLLTKIGRSIRKFVAISDQLVVDCGQLPVVLS